ncbi:hypothetical protein BH160DRAFT_3850 [Burkholderia sp. H160]|nr:hypothetical protein BH160DRAFT_3850 [Burkholderia sp. H160]
MRQFAPKGLLTNSCRLFQQMLRLSARIVFTDAAGTPKKGRSGTGSLSRRAQYEDSRSGWWLGHARKIPPHGRSSWRLAQSLGIGGRRDTCQPRVRRSIRCGRRSRVLARSMCRSSFRVAPIVWNSVIWTNICTAPSRNLVERFFARVKQFRCISTRYDKLSERYSSFIALAAAFIWLV